MTTSARAAAGRRRAAPHPGPFILREHLAPLNLDAASLAPQIGMKPALLAKMLAGRAGIDVETAVRLSHALQLSADGVMEMQLRHDFALARSNRKLAAIDVLQNDGRLTFPAQGYLQGRLSGLPENSQYVGVRFETLAFREDGAPERDVYLRLHPIRPGNRLRVYGDDGRPFWTGVVLATLAGEPLLPYARPSTWIDWFVTGFRADFIAGP